jgi:hypothetical protein
MPFGGLPLDELIHPAEGRRVARGDEFRAHPERVDGRSAGRERVDFILVHVARCNDFALPGPFPSLVQDAADFAGEGGRLAVVEPHGSLGFMPGP